MTESLPLEGFATLAGGGELPSPPLSSPPLDVAIRPPPQQGVGVPENEGAVGGWRNGSGTGL